MLVAPRSETRAVVSVSASKRANGATEMQNPERTYSC
jgi:hypothetical protein